MKEKKLMAERVKRDGIVDMRMEICGNRVRNKMRKNGRESGNEERNEMGERAKRIDVKMEIYR